MPFLLQIATPPHAVRSALLGAGQGNRFEVNPNLCRNHEHIDEACRVAAELMIHHGKNFDISCCIGSVSSSSEPAAMAVLVLGGTGKTGLHLVQQLLARGFQVKAIVRSPEKLPVDVARHSGLTVITAKVLDLSDEAIVEHLTGCTAVISCLGHEGNYQGMCGKASQNLVSDVLRRVCRAVADVKSPVKVILMSTGLYTKPDSAEDVRVRNSCGQRALLCLLSTCLPPHNDNMRAAEFLRTELVDKGIEWCAVRPELLIDGEVTQYELHESLVCSIFSAGQTTRANVAHFMCELVQDPSVWQKWNKKFPLIYNAA
eukprot:s4353_g2.t1